MLKLTQQQLIWLIEYLSDQLETLERIQSVSTTSTTTPTTSQNKGQ